MTIPVERTHAVLRTREFLINLLNPKATPRVPRAIRQSARALLKHYPAAWDFEPNRINNAFADPSQRL